MKYLLAITEIPATDFNRAVKFYETLFNCKLYLTDSLPEKMALFPGEPGKSPVAVSFAADFKPSKDGVLIYLSVENMEESIFRIEKNGGKIITPKTKIAAEERGYFSVFMDVEGNRIGLYSDK